MASKYPQVEKYFVRLDAVHNISKQLTRGAADFTLWCGGKPVKYGTLRECLGIYADKVGMGPSQRRAWWDRYFKEW